VRHQPATTSFVLAPPLFRTLFLFVGGSIASSHLPDRDANKPSDSESSCQKYGRHHEIREFSH
jgi:hypothetical protein